MLNLPRKTLYALEAVVDIAYNARPEPVQSKDITRRQGIPHRYLEQVLQHLVRNGILPGVRGPRGGYRLARERRRITVAEIVRLLDALDARDGEDETEGSEMGRLIVRPLLGEIQQEMVKRLESVTIEDLCQRATKAGVGKAAPDTPDFSI